MEEYNFDIAIDRKNTDSVKYDCHKEGDKTEGLLPLWVADMDFKTAPQIVEALVGRAEHGIYGYTHLTDRYYDAVRGWMGHRHHWDIKKEWILATPGVVYALASAIRNLTQPGDHIMIQTPVYHPFFSAVVNNERNLVQNPLHYTNGRYEMDFEDFEKKIVDHQVKLFVLCNPHNPVGRVWTEKELLRVGDICLRHKVIVISDEIHQDFIYEGHEHMVFANVKEEYKDMTITCTSPSKTFNLAGLQLSNTITSNMEYKEKMQKDMDALGQDNVNVFGLEACLAAYTQSETWLEELKKYLKGNLDYVRAFIKTRLPGITLIEPEGLYLVWIDCTALGLSDEALEKLIEGKAKLKLSGGMGFGIEGSGFQRINIACPRSQLEKALLQLEEAISH